MNPSLMNAYFNHKDFWFGKYLRRCFFIKSRLSISEQFFPHISPNTQSFNLSQFRITGFHLGSVLYFCFGESGSLLLFDEVFYSKAKLAHTEARFQEVFFHQMNI